MWGLFFIVLGQRRLTERIRKTLEPAKECFLSADRLADVPVKLTHIEQESTAVIGDIDRDLALGITSSDPEVQYHMHLGLLIPSLAF